MKNWNSFGRVVVVIAAVALSAADAKAQIGLADGKAQMRSAASINDERGATLIEATRKLKADSENLIFLQESEIAKATEKLQQLRTLVADGLVAKNELQQSEDNLSTLQKRLETTRQQVADADRTISAIVASEQLVKSQAETAKLLAKSRSFITPTFFDITDKLTGQSQTSAKSKDSFRQNLGARFRRALLDKVARTTNWASITDTPSMLLFILIAWKEGS